MPHPAPAAQRVIPEISSSGITKIKNQALHPRPAPSVPLPPSGSPAGRPYCCRRRPLRAAAGAPRVPTPSARSALRARCAALPAACRVLGEQAGEPDAQLRMRHVILGQRAGRETESNKGHGFFRNNRCVLATQRQPRRRTLHVGASNVARP
eukprot:364917-Chlamydomonas_euryale.AAC.5